MTEKAEKIQNRPSHLFKPGQSGNPAGKPKGLKSYSTLFEQAIRKIAVADQLDVNDVEVKLATVAILRALKGDYKFYKDTMDRVYGSSDKTEVNIDNRQVTIKWMEGDGSSDTISTTTTPETIPQQPE